MKKIIPSVLILGFGFSSCESEVPKRGDLVSFDNPTAEKIYVIVDDDDTLLLPPYTSIENYPSVCTGAENITYPSGHLPGLHRYRVLDADMKQIFDTTVQSRERFLLINPTKSTYVEWTVLYGEDSLNPPRYDTLYFNDSLPYIGMFKVYNSFVIENEARHSVTCDRTIAASKEIYRFEETEQFMPEMTSDVKFFRLDDFLTAYEGFPGPTERDLAETRLHNILNDFHYNAVNHKSCPVTGGELGQIDGFINSKQYDKAADIVNYNEDYFRKRDSASFAAMNRLVRIYYALPETHLVLQFTPLYLWRYDLDNKGAPYKDEEDSYDVSTGECKTTNFDAPRYD